MQNKKSVLFIEPENMISEARAIKKELIKDTQFAGVVIAEKKLRCLVKNAVFDKLAPEGGSARNFYKKTRKNLFKRKPEIFTYGDACGLPQKTVRNLLYRFVPDVVVVSTEEALRSIVVERKKLGIKCSLCVLCGEEPNAELVAKEVDHYFVKDTQRRNALIGIGATEDKIVMGTVSMAENIGEDEQRVSAKESLGLDQNKLVVYLAENAGEEEKVKIKNTLPKTQSLGIESIFYCGTDTETAEFISVCGGRVVSDKSVDEMLMAADLVVTCGDAEIKELAEELKRPVVSIKDESRPPELIISDALMRKEDPARPTPPYRYFADCLKNMLEEKMNAEPIETNEEEKEDWVLEKQDEEEE